MFNTKNKADMQQTTTNGNGDVFLAKLQSYGVAIKETVGNSTVKVFPNPADEYFYIAGNADLNDNESVLTVFNSLCEMVICEHYQLKTNIARIGCNNLASGIYSLLLETGNHFYRGKLIKK